MPPTKITLELSREALEVVDQIRSATGDDMADVFRKALALYRTALYARERGEAVGAAKDASVLEIEFVGF